MSKPRVAVLTHSKLTQMLKEVLAEKPWPAEVVLYDVLLEEAARKAQQLEASGQADVLVTGGANATFLESLPLTLPVVRIKVTGFDLMQALWSAKRLDRSAVVMSYREPFPQLEWFRDLFQVELIQKVYRDVDDAQDQLYRLLKDGQPAIIGASLICELTERLGGQSIFIYSKSSIRMALETAVDLAVQRRTEIEKREKIEAMMQAVRDGIVYVDNDGLLREMNPAAEQLLGISVQDAIGRPAQDIVPELNVDEVFEKGEPLLNVVQKGKTGMLLVNRIPVIHQGKQIGAVATFQDADSVQQAEKAIRKRVYSKGLSAKATFEDIVGQSAPLQKAIDKARQYALSDATVLIHGETGTGKELFAQSIHNASRRRHHPFVAVNCAALPESLLESELFGYEEGAFTGAKKGGKPGLFELAHRGTLFLDEVGEMSLPLQARLLRVLQEKEVMRIGSESIVPIDVRVLAATNRDLKAMVEEGTFRRDLYYRLNVLSLELPPLRKRLDDLPELLRHLLEKYDLEEAKKESVMAVFPALLSRYDWPGNVRELENVVERITVLASGGFSIDEIAREVAGELLPDGEEIAPPDLAKEVESWERQRILQVLSEAEGNKTKAARLLGISRSTLWRKMRAYSLDDG